MRRTETIILLLTALISPIFSVSVEGTELVNPFPSEENLSLFTFDSPDAEDLSDWEINLVSTRTGGPVYSYFGHTSLEVVPPGRDSMFFDYGYFTFSDGFYLNFALGRLYYNMYASWGDWRMDQFRREDRTVWKTPLPLTDAQKEGMIKFLEYNEKPENNTYLYHYYNDNCATRVRDILNAASGGEFRKWAESIDTGHSLRSSSSMYLDKTPAISFAINYLQGPLVDRPITLWDAMYLPEALQYAAEEFFGTESEMIHETTHRVDHRKMPLAVASAVAGTSIAVMLISAWKFDRKRLLRTFEILMGILWIVLGVMSSVLLFMMLFTNHDVTFFNENLLYISPLVFLMGFESLRGKRHRKRYWTALIHLAISSAVLIVKLVVPALFWQKNLPVFLFIIPLYIAEVWRNRRNG